MPITLRRKIRRYARDYSIWQLRMQAGRFRKIFLEIMGNGIIPGYGGVAMTDRLLYYISPIG